MLRHSRDHFNPAGSKASHGGGGNVRPWTTGELADNESCDGAKAADIGGILHYEGGRQSRARSADGVTLSPHPVGSDLGTAAEHLDGAVDKVRAEADGLETTPEEVSGKSSDFFASIGDDGQEKVDGGDGVDGATVDGDGCEDLELPVVLSQPMPRRVSFADEQGSSDGSGDSTEEPNSEDQRRARRGSQRRRMSSIIGSSDGYLEGDGSINGGLVGRDGRRKSDLERCRRAMEIARVAHDLLFLDTRPDGLRPITGTPMADGRNALGSGGLYVGPAGLRGFDLSFVGAAPANLIDTRQNLGSVAARLATSRRLSAYAAANNNDESSVVTGSSSSRADASWIAQGFLLDRKPGSLMPRLPRSAGRAPATEMGQTSPRKNSSSNSEVDDEGGIHSPPNETVTSNGSSPTAAESNSEPPPSPASSSNAQQAQKTAMEDESNAAKVDSSTAPVPAEGSSPQTQDAPSGREQIGSEGELCGGPRGGEYTRRENGGRSRAPVPEIPSGTTVVVSNAATAMAAPLAPKAAVLWSARDLGVDELVSSVAGDQEVNKLHACLALRYFEVSANRCVKDGAARGVPLTESHDACCHFVLTLPYDTTPRLRMFTCATCGTAFVSVSVYLTWCSFSIVQVVRPPGSRDFTSRALLAAYKQASPVFEVSWRRKT